VLRDLAEHRDVPIDVVAAVDGQSVVRLASLVGLADWVSVYAAIAAGVDPTPIGPITELKDRIS
jgi:glucose/mannose-6-phosphate isomerase